MMIKRLPEFIRIIHNYFITEKKTAIPYENVINKLVDSYHSSIAMRDAKDHIDYVAKLLPEWIMILQVERGTYVKIEKNKSISDLINKVNNSAIILRSNF